MSHSTTMFTGPSRVFLHQAAAALAAHGGRSMSAVAAPRFKAMIMLKRKDGIKREDFESEWGVPHTSRTPRLHVSLFARTTLRTCLPTVRRVAVHVATHNGCSVTAIFVVMEELRSSLLFCASEHTDVCRRSLRVACSSFVKHCASRIHRVQQECRVLVAVSVAVCSCCMKRNVHILHRRTGATNILWDQSTHFAISDLVHAWQRMCCVHLQCGGSPSTGTWR